ncbi:unnamed protein product [Alternaria burnsii]|nr:unnamed protein product [Alternaria burnsii]
MARVEGRNKAAHQLNAVRREFEEKVNAMVDEKVAYIKRVIGIRMREFEVRSATLKKQEEDLKASTARLARIEEKSKTYKDLCNAVAGVADKINKAERGRQNLTARKNTTQSAFERWEQQYCQPIKKLADLIWEVDNKKQENDREFAEQSAVVRGQEAQTAALLLQRQQEEVMLNEEKEQFLVEKQEWQLKQGKQLSATEVRAAMEVFLQKKIEQIKPDVLAEAKHSVWMLPKQDFETRKVENLARTKAEGKVEGYRRGYEDGYAQAKLEENEQAYSMGMIDARQEYQLRIIEAKRESRDEGYDLGYEAGYEVGANRNCDEIHTIGYEKGRNAGHSQGHQKGYAKGFSQGLEAVRREADGTAWSSW